MIQTTTSPSSIAKEDIQRYEARLAAVHERIAGAAARAGRDPAEVTLVAVCKTVGRYDIDAAYAAGQRDFGENRVQDARAKFSDAVPADLRLHMIGSLQTNKVRQVVGMFDLVHSVDRIALVDEIERRAAAQGTVQPILVQVNIAREQQKHGCLVEDIDPLIEAILCAPHVHLRGLMTMAPLTATAEEARPVFVGLRELRDELRVRFPQADLRDLSMGMTNDFEAAIEEGATLVRVGRAIFA